MGKAPASYPQAVRVVCAWVSDGGVMPGGEVEADEHPKRAQDRAKATEGERMVDRKRLRSGGIAQAPTR
jgi:hypothetical protein